MTVMVSSWLILSVYSAASRSRFAMVSATSLYRAIDTVMTAYSASTPLPGPARSRLIPPGFTYQAGLEAMDQATVHEPVLVEREAPGDRHELSLPD
jgi:hypothetical protein